MQRYTVYFIWKLLYMFRVVFPPIIRRENNYLQHLAFVTPLLLLPLLWKSWNWFECAVGGVRLMIGDGTTRNM
jgi:hypothetical protein